MKHICLSILHIWYNNHVTVYGQILSEQPQSCRCPVTPLCMWQYFVSWRALMTHINHGLSTAKKRSWISIISTKPLDSTRNPQSTDLTKRYLLSKSDGWMSLRTTKYDIRRVDFAHLWKRLAPPSSSRPVRSVCLKWNVRACTKVDGKACTNNYTLALRYLEFHTQKSLPNSRMVELKRKEDPWTDMRMTDNSVNNQNFQVRIGVCSSN